MTIRQLHRWDVSPAEAIEIQKRLRDSVRMEACEVDRVELIAGCDISFEFETVEQEATSARGQLGKKQSETVYAGIVVLRLPHFEEVDRAVVVTTAQFPYIPGLLSFRESPAVLEAWQKLQVAPQAVMIDGHGYSHPRRFGIACHLGVLLDLPTVGCAKTVLVGTFEEPAEKAGSGSPLIHHGETVGRALRTRDGVSPVFVSVGHRVDLETATRLVLRSTATYRIPEPTRRAHLLVNAARRGEVDLSSRQASLFG